MTHTTFAHMYSIDYIRRIYRKEKGKCGVKLGRSARRNEKKRKKKKHGARTFDTY